MLDKNVAIVVVCSHQPHRKTKSGHSQRYASRSELRTKPPDENAAELLLAGKQNFSTRRSGAVGFPETARKGPAFQASAKSTPEQIICIFWHRLITLGVEDAKTQKTHSI
jgi:hypothetical protein